MQWFSVNRASPCLVCDKPDWCARSADGSWMLCRRVDAGGRHRIDSTGTDYWLYSTDQSVETDVAVVPPGPRDAPEVRADDATLDKVYRALLDVADLGDEHRDQLLQRGLSAGAIEDRLYRSIDQPSRRAVVTQLRKDFSDEVLLGVPGFYMRRGRLALGGDNGLWIPVANAIGSIVGIKIRRDEEEDEPRYRHLSSRRHGGPGPGAQVHVPLGFDGDTRRVRLTEGELKADVATALTGLLTLSKPGVSQWRGALPVLHSLGVETVVLADDSDGWTNQHVAKAIKRSVEGMREAVYTIEMETWPAEVGKGIDDLLARGGSPELVQGDVVDDVVYGMVEEAERVSPAPHETELRQAVAHANVIAEAAETDPGAAFVPKALGVLALVKRRSPPDWQRIRARLVGPRSKVSRRDLNEALSREGVGEGVQAFQVPDGGADPAGSNGHEPDLSGVFWEPPKWRWISAEIIRRLSEHGYFIRAEGLSYFFDRDRKQLCEIANDCLDLTIILNERYAVNPTDRLYSYLIHQLTFEAVKSGQPSKISQFAYYDDLNNRGYLDMHDGSVLRLNGHDIEIQDNGVDGVLFAPVPFAEPWSYDPTPGPTIAETLIEPMSFAEDESTPYTPDQQRLLMLIWMLSVAMVSIQPTKPLALAVGPAGSGKSSFFRRIGRLLFGSRYQVAALRKDKEDDYWVTVTNRPFATCDNVDGYIPWLNDALAQTSTGVQVSKRRLHTTNTVVEYTPNCMLSLTARTPTFRRDDIASRLLIFHLDRLPEKRPEHDLLKEVQVNRNALMSDYARMLNRVLAVTPSDVAVDRSIRLADFVDVAARIGAALGASELMGDLLSLLRRSQNIYATEENPLYLLIDTWLTEPPAEGSQMGLNGVTNIGRTAMGRELFAELSDLAEKRGIRWGFKNEISMGIAIKNMADDLGLHFDIASGRDRRGRWYRITPRESDEL